MNPPMKLYEREAGQPLSLASFVLQSIKEEVHDYSCLLARLPKNLAAEVHRFSQTIPNRELGEDGREDDPHVTILYGFHNPFPEKSLVNMLAATKHIPVTLGRTAVFDSNPDYDVLYASVNSPMLEQLHYRCRENYKCTVTHPAYTPHVTIAYLKKGEADKYSGSTELKDWHFRVSEVHYAQPDETKVKLPLGVPR